MVRVERRGADADLFVIDAGGALSFLDAPDFGAPGDGAEIRLQVPRRVMGEPNAAGHVDETVALLVLQKGVHTPADGTTIQVGEVSTDKLCVSGCEDVAFAPGFDANGDLLSGPDLWRDRPDRLARRESPASGPRAAKPAPDRLHRGGRRHGRP